MSDIEKQARFKRNLRREHQIILRFTAKEKNVIKKNAAAVGLYIVEYVRCKIFDYPMEPFSGRPRKMSKESLVADPKINKDTAEEKVGNPANPAT